MCCGVNVRSSYEFLIFCSFFLRVFLCCWHLHGFCLPTAMAAADAWCNDPLAMIHQIKFNANESARCACLLVELMVGLLLLMLLATTTVLSAAISMYICIVISCCCCDCFCCCGEWQALNTPCLHRINARQSVQLAVNARARLTYTQTMQWCNIFMYVCNLHVCL